MQNLRYAFFSLLILILPVAAMSQLKITTGQDVEINKALVNDSPNGDYGWKKLLGTQTSKRVPGYIIYTSGEKVTGSLVVAYRGKDVIFISVNGSEQNLTHITHFGLTSKTMIMVNQSPDEMYIWQDPTILSSISWSLPWLGYVVLLDSTRHEGELSIGKKGNLMVKVKLVQGNNKEEYEPVKVARYGLLVSMNAVMAEQIKRGNYSWFEGGKVWPPGSADKKGLVAIRSLKDNNPKLQEMYLKDSANNYFKYTPFTTVKFSYLSSGNVIKFISMDSSFVQEEFDGTTYQMFRDIHPAPEINYNEKGAFSSFKNKIYAEKLLGRPIENTEKLDFIFNNSSVEQLRELLKEDLKPGAAKNIELGIEAKTENTKTTYPLGMVILNKNYQTKTLVKEGTYPTAIGPLQQNCNAYSSLDAATKARLSQWPNRIEFVKFLDSNPCGTPAASSGLSIAETVGAKSFLLLREQLTLRKSIMSPNGTYVLTQQEDGNLVIYNMLSRKAIWESGSIGKGVERTVLDEDGSLVQYSKVGPVWSSKCGGNNGITLVMQDDGNLVIINLFGNAIWSSNTTNK